MGTSWHRGADRDTFLRIVVAVLVTAAVACTEARGQEAMPTVVGEWARTGQPGDVIPVTGARLDDPRLRFVVTSRGTDGSVRNEEVGPLAVQDATVAAFRLPASFSPDSTFHVTPKVGEQTSAPFTVNAPETWWVGPRPVTRGGTAAIFGRNLLDHRGVPRVSLSLVHDRSGPLTVVDANPNRLRVSVPPSLEPGTYRIEARDTEAATDLDTQLELVVVDGDRAAARPSLNVRQFGASGDGVHDDAPAIVRASALARAAGATLYFPRGTYAVHAPIVIESDTQWTGDGPDATTLVFRLEGMELWTMPGKLAALTNLGRKVEGVALEGIGLELGSTPPAIAEFAFLFLRNATSVRLDRVRVFSLFEDIADLNGSRQIHVHDSSFSGQDLFTGDSKYIDIERCAFKLTRATHASIIVAGGEAISVTDSHFEDADPDDAGDSRLFTTQGYAGSVRNIYIGNNVSVGIAPGPQHKNQNAGEQILIEMSTPLQAGRVAGADSTSVHVGDDASGRRDPARAVTMDMTIVAGRGVGQSRRITALDVRQGIYSVFPAWRVVPDETSRFVVSSVATNLTVHGNRLSGKPDWKTRLTASAGVQCYGDCLHVVISSNEISNVRHGISLWAQAPDIEMTTVTYFSHVSDNTITNTIAAVAEISFNLPRKAASGTIGLLGNQEVRNTVRQAEDAASLMIGCNRAVGWASVMNVSAENRLSDSRSAIALANQPSVGSPDFAPLDVAERPVISMLKSRTPGDVTAIRFLAPLSPQVCEVRTF